MIAGISINIVWVCQFISSSEEEVKPDERVRMEEELLSMYGMTKDNRLKYNGYESRKAGGITFMEGQKYIVLNDNQKILLNDKIDIVISVVYNGEMKYTFPVSYPAEGYGGGTLFLSLSERYLLFSYYSGQSEEAFMVFKIEGYGLELLYESGYLCGEGAGYIFSDNEEFLFQALRTGWWYAEQAETDKDGNPFYEFGEINVLDIRTKTFSKHRIYIYPSNDWKEEVTDEGDFLLSKTVNNDILYVIMPWGKEALNLPLKDVIVFKPE